MRKRSKIPRCIFCNRPVHGRSKGAVILVHGTRLHSSCMSPLLMNLEAHRKTERTRRHLMPRLAPADAREIFGEGFDGTD